MSDRRSCVGCIGMGACRAVALAAEPAGRSAVTGTPRRESHSGGGGATREGTLNKEMTMPDFAAEILVLDPVNVPRVTAALAAEGVTYVVDPDATDDYPTVFGMAVGTADNDLDVGGYLQCIVWELGGDVVQWHFGPP